MSVIDLTQITIPNGYGPDEPQSDYSMRKDHVSVEVVFRNHQKRLLELIASYPYVLGCVAWFTDLRVLDALANCKGVGILVQKEDFLRPDLANETDFGLVLRKVYARLPNFNRHETPGISSDLSVCSDNTTAPVRCVGNHNADKHPAWPRMHNKFLVFCTYEKPEDPLYPGSLRPECVWTGSYNLTFNAQKSFENSVIIRDPEVAEAYGCEWAQILALSEPLDWETRWCEPEYRIGT